MTLKVEMFIKRHVLYVRFDGELDQHNVESLRVRIIELIDKYLRSKITRKDWLLIPSIFLIEN